VTLRDRLISVLAPVAALSSLAVLASPAPPSVGSPGTARPSAPATAKPSVVRAVSLVGTTLHLPGGRRIALPQAAGRYPVLLGTAPRRGWVLASGGTFRLVRPDGTVRRIAGRNGYDLYVTEALADDGRRVVSASFDQGDALSVRVVDLAGKVAQHHSFQDVYVDVLDAAGSTVWVGGRSGLFALDELTGRTRLLRKPTALVDQAHDVVFVGTRKRPGRVGPTSLADPGTPAWRTRSRPVAVSPDGVYVVNGDGTVRSMTDGRVVRRVPAPPRGDEFRFLGWASTRRVLVETSAGRRSVLLSCPLPEGSCRRVGATTGRVSVPTSHAGPFLQP